MKTKIYHLVAITVLLLSSVHLQAQVTIGSESAPHLGALLDLKQQSPTLGTANSNKGVLLPRVFLRNAEKLQLGNIIGTNIEDSQPITDGDNTDTDYTAVGMIVWNTNQSALNGTGTYQWDGEKWIEIFAAGINCIPVEITDPTIEQTVSIIKNGDNTETTFQINTVTGSNPLHYQWYKDGAGAITSEGTGYDSKTYTTSNSLATGTYTYHCVVTSDCGESSEATSVDFTLAVCQQASITPTATTNVLMLAGTSTTTLAVVGTVGDGNTPSYQWYDNVGAISSANDATYTTDVAGTYYCIVTSSCGTSNTAQSGDFIVEKLEDIPLDIAATSTLIGKTCFDIVNGNNDADGCALLTERESQAVNFSIRTPQDASVSTEYSGVQIYNFTSPTPVSKLRFVYEEAADEGYIVESIVPSSDYATATGITSAQVTVYYKETLQTDLQGKNRDEAFKLKLYAIYNANSGGTGGVAADRKVELTIRLQDCACCGAYVAPGVWKELMCHNLGADDKVNPFISTRDINGSYFQWGSQTAVLTQNADDDATPASGWSSTAPTTVYGNGATGSDVKVKSMYDPCPDGYRVPSYDELYYAMKNNTKLDEGEASSWESGGATVFNGSNFGVALFLPSAGYRANGTGQLYYRGRSGYYWTTQISSTNAVANYFSSGGSEFVLSQNRNRAFGIPVRCISQ